MLTARIKIGNGAEVDTRTYGLVYLDSDKVVGAVSKGFESTSYPEEPGEHILPKTVDAAFDYKVKFFIDPTVPDGATPSLYTINKKIASFNARLYDYELDENEQPTNVKVFKKVTFYNDTKRHVIVGYPDEISEATEFWRDPSNQRNDIAVVEWTIHVKEPQLCKYDSAN